MKHALRNTLVGLAVAAALTFAYLHARRQHDRPQQGVASGAPAARLRSVKEAPASNASSTAPAVATTTPLTPTAVQTPATAANLASARTTSTNGQSARDWDPAFLSSLTGKSDGSPLRFELTEGEWAEGIINHVERLNGEIVYVGGKLSSPDTGRFFFRKNPPAGPFSAVVELTTKEIAYRLESVPSGSLKLVRRKLGEVLCLRFPMPGPTNQVANTPPLNPTQFPTNLPTPAYQNGILALQSLPAAKGVIYLDFQGGYTPTSGGVKYDRPNLSNADIYSIWELVAERYLPFNINITTDLKVFQEAQPTSRQRTIITPMPGAGVGGWSYGGCFNWGGIPDQPNWVYLLDVKGCGEAIAHECGHALGLGHHGQEIGTNHVEYYGGQGTGDTGWAPIMGVAYYHPLGQWAKGEYQYANNTNQDDIAIIVNNNNNVDFRTDDTGSTFATARYLELYPGNTASAQGVIETAGDTDAFRFTLTNSGLINLTANPNLIRHWDGDWGSLAVAATLCDSTETVIGSNCPPNLASATISANLPAGDYTFRVHGAGRNDPFTTGFSTYGSIGYYSVTGTVTKAVLPTRFVIGENTPNGTLVGNVPPSVANGDPRTYTILSGNTGGAFTLADTGNITVADSTQLNYETLGLDSQLPVQFELFVQILDSLNPALAETNRVVIGITNVNESPILSAADMNVLAHTQLGTVIGTVTASDPDFFGTLGYSIVAGNSNNAFAIDGNGAITVAGELDDTVQSVYNLSVAVSDLLPSSLMTTGSVTVTVLANTSPFRPGSISYAIYTNIPGQLVSDLTGASSYPDDPAWEKQELLFDGELGIGEHYGAVMRGYLIPPATGSYRFWIASDDNSELWLSTSSPTNPASATRRAYLSGANTISGYCSWTDHSSQRSSSISLTAGQPYYIEARLKEHEGGDYVSVAWNYSGTTNIIPGKYLAPYFRSYKPDPANVTTSLHRDAFAGSLVGTLPLLGASTNIPRTFILTAGNTDGIFSLNSSNGAVRVANETALRTTAQSSYTLTIQVSNNIPPAFPATADFTINLVDSNALVATSICQEVFTNIGSDATVASLTSASKYPNRPDFLRPLTNFYSGTNDIGDNYGSRIRGLLTAPAGGTYNFFIASDDNSQLLFSLTTNPANATVCASVGGWTDRLKWNVYSSQRSANFSLTGGQRYYIEARHKEAGGGDHVEVGWTGPGLSGTNIIDLAQLSAVDLNAAPTMTNRSLIIPYSIPNGTVITTMAATDSPVDKLAYRITSGNANNAFGIDVDTGQLFIANNAAIVSQTQGAFSLQVQVQDNGYSDLYPRRSATAVVTVNVQPDPLDVSATVHRDAVAGSRLGVLPVVGGVSNAPRTFTILGGNSEGIFSVNPGNGVVRVASEAALQNAAHPSYNLLIQVANNIPPALPATATFTVNVVEASAIVATSLCQEVFLNMGTDSTVESLLASPKYPRRPDLLRPLASFYSGPADIGHDYGSRIRGLLAVPANGTYNLFVASDDNSRLLFSATTNADDATVSASAEAWTDRLQWSVFPSQRTADLLLAAGQRCYIEALHKEHDGGDHVEIGWTGPGLSGTNIIDGALVSPVDINYAPELTNRSLVLTFPVTNGTVLDTLSAMDSPLDALVYKIVSGNTNNTFSLDPDTGRLSVSNNSLIANQVVAAFNLQIQVQDNGYSDLYPRHAATANVSVTVQPVPVNVTNAVHRDAVAGSRLGVLPVLGGLTNAPRTFTILSGNAEGIFSVNSSDGMVRVASDIALRNAAQSSYNLLIEVANVNPPVLPATATFTINVVESNAIVATSLYQEVFLNIGAGTDVASLQASPKYPRRPDLLRALTAFDSGTNVGDNYGSRIRGLLTPPGTGVYNLYIASDENSQLLFSMTTNPADAMVRASVATSTAYREWAKFSAQHTPNLSLAASQQYYVEALHKESSGADHVEVAWTGPGLSGTPIIAASQLSPVDLNYPPDFTNRTLVISPTIAIGTVLTTLVASDSPLDVLAYAIIDGNISNTFSLDSDTGRLVLADNTLLANQSVSTFSLTVQVQDSGYSDLYPRRSTDAIVTVNVTRPSQILPPWLSGENLMVQFPTLAGMTYVLQTTTNLTPPALWTSVSTNAGTGGIGMVSLPVASGPPQAYFRVMSY